MGRVIGWRDDAGTFHYTISGGVGGCPPPVSPPVSPPPPPHIPARIATPAGARQGSEWVESSERHYIGSDGDEFGGTGTSVATPPGAVTGSNWVEGEDDHYIDASGVERTLQLADQGAKPAPAISGSAWINSNPPDERKELMWIGATRKSLWSNGGA